MRLVYLIKHATPQIQPTVPAEDWELSAAGIAEAKRLATLARGWGLGAVYSSSEPKARKTGLILADELAVPLHVVEGFEEIRLGWIGNSDEFSANIRDILEHPADSVRGAERAGDAASRFAAAMRMVEAGPLPAAVVSHGRIISAYLADAFAVEDPFALWRAIPLAGWATLDLDTRKILTEFAPAPEA